MTVYEETLASLQQSYPKLKVKTVEDSKLVKVLDFVAWWVDLVDGYNTTICNTIYIQKEYVGTLRGADILWHEAVHVRQWQRWNVLYYLSYFLLLPVGITMRAYWEWQAYSEELLRVKRITGTITEKQEEAVVRLFTGPSYLFMWPFPSMVRGWIRKIRESV